MKKKRSSPPEQTILDKAEVALQRAVAKVVAEHRRTGEPLAVWRDGRLVMLPPDQAVVREAPARYRTKRKP